MVSSVVRYAPEDPFCLVESCQKAIEWILWSHAASGQPIRRAWSAVPYGEEEITRLEEELLPAMAPRPGRLRPALVGCCPCLGRCCALRSVVVGEEHRGDRSLPLPPDVVRDDPERGVLGGGVAGEEAFSWIILRPPIASMATLALNSGLWVRHLLMMGAPFQGRCPASKVNDGGCPGKPDHLTPFWCFHRG
jgi:hypothetical protein